LLDTVDALNEDELEFDFFADPETAETVEQGWRRPPRRTASHAGGGGPHGLPPGLVGVRRLSALVMIVIAGTGGLVSGLGACQGAGPDYAGYLRGVVVLARSSNKDGAQLAIDLRSPPLTGSLLASKLQNLASQEQRTYDQAAQMSPPGPLRAVHGELLSALELRASGLAELGQTLGLAAPTTNQLAANAKALAAQARLLTTSDVVWTQLYQTPVTQKLHTRRITDATVPPSRFVSNPELVTAPAFTHLLQRLRGITTPRPVPILKPGATGTAVKTWQRQLNRWLRAQPGQTLLPIDGAFGAQTKAATKALQQAAGITADGIVGPTTRNALSHQLTHTG
jgi:putative peptidoglycan binding protein